MLISLHYVMQQQTTVRCKMDRNALSTVRNGYLLVQRILSEKYEY